MLFTRSKFLEYIKDAIIKKIKGDSNGRNAFDNKA